MTSSESAALRVAAAEDVLSRIIPDEDLTLTTGCYLDTHHKTGKPCRACAAGALTLAVIAPDVAGKMMTTTGLTLAEEINAQLNSDAGVNEWNIQAALTAIFDLDQIALIEAAFMRGHFGYFADRCFRCKDGRSLCAQTIHIYYDADELLEADDLAFYRSLDDAVQFGMSYEYQDERLEAIMQNIVRNNGTFVPGE